MCIEPLAGYPRKRRNVIAAGGALDNSIVYMFAAPGKCRGRRWVAGVGSDPDKARALGGGAKRVLIRVGWIGAGMISGLGADGWATEMRGGNVVSPGWERVE